MSFKPAPGQILRKMFPEEGDKIFHITILAVLREIQPWAGTWDVAIMGAQEVFVYRLHYLDDWELVE